MASDLQLFGVTHLLILGSVAASVAALIGVCRARPGWVTPVRYVLAGGLAGTALSWYGYLAAIGAVSFPETLPLDLCDVTLWVAVVAASTLSPFAVEVVYFLGVGGSTLALLTPDLWAPVRSWPSLTFFSTHALVVATPLVLIGSGAARPRQGSPLRVFLVANGYATALALFNFWFGTNYMYLCRKPANPSLLDYFGPWPIYLASGELFAALVFWILWQPCRHMRTPRPLRE